MKQYSESLVGNDAAPVVEDGARYPASPVPGSPVPSQQMGYPPQQTMPPQQMPPQQMQYPPQQMQYPPPQNMSGYITQPPPTSLPGGGPLPGQFSSDCCGCCEDCIICCGTCCIQPIGHSQLHQRYSAPPKANKCKIMLGVTVTLVLLAMIFNFVAWNEYGKWMSRKADACNGELKMGDYGWGVRAPTGWSMNDASECYSPPPSSFYIMGFLASIFVSVNYFLGCFTLMTVRQKIRRAHGIPAQCCGDGCDDCCCACCCPLCTQCQLLRHTLKHAVVPQRPGYPAIPATYEFCSEEGTSYPPPPELETVGGAGTYPQGGMPMQQMGGIAPVPAHVAQSHAQGGAYMAHNAV